MIVYFEGVARTLQRCLTRLRELALALSGLSWAEVKAMAVQLGMDFPALSQIEQQTSEFSDRLHATMDAWLKTDPHASWKAAVRALRAINKNVLAMELEEKYAPTLPAPPAPGDETLGEGDAMTIFEEILEAQNQSHYLGLKWRVPAHIVESIHSQHSSPKDRLYHLIVEFLTQVEPRPTWRVVVDALRSPAVGLPQLAKRVERNHCQLMSPPPTLAGSQVEKPPPLLVASCTKPSPVPLTSGSSVTRSGPLRSLSGRPTLPELCLFRTRSGSTIRILQQIGGHYSDLGIHLLQDDSGAITQALASQYSHDANAINQTILSRWIQGMGRHPVTWDTLIEILDNIGLPLLANEIKEGL